MYSTTTIPKLDRYQITQVRQIVIEVLKDVQKCFQDLIIDINKELAMNPSNEFIEVLEDIRDIARESLPEIEADLHKFGVSNKKL